MKKNRTLSDGAKELITAEELDFSVTDMQKEDKEIVEKQEEQLKPFFSSFDDFAMYVRFDMGTKMKYLQEMDKNYYMCNFDRAADLAKDPKSKRRSNVKTILTNMFVNRVVNMALEFDKRFSFLDKKAETRDPDEKKAMEISKKLVDEVTSLLDTVISQEQNRIAIADSIKDVVKDGFSYPRVGFKRDQITRKYKAYNEEKTINYTDEYMTIDYVSNYNMVIAYGPSRRLSFVGERILMRDGDIEKEFVMKYGMVYDKEKATLDEAKILIPYDFESIKQSMLFYNFKDSNGVFQDSKNIGGGVSNEIDTVSLEGKSFQLSDTFSIQKKGVIREVFCVYHDHDDGLYMDVYVNGSYIGTTITDSPMPGYKHYMMTFRRIPGSMGGTGVATVCAPTQKVYDTIINLRIDNTIVNTNTVYLKRRNINLGGGNGVVAITPGMTIEVDDPQKDVRVLERTSMPPEAYNEPSNMFDMLQTGIGLAGQAMGRQDKVTRVAGEMDALRSATDDSMNEFVESLNAFFNRVAKNVLVYYSTVASKETIEKIIGKDSQFAKEPIEDILRDLSISFDISSQKAKYNAALTQILLNFLATVGNLVDEKGQKVANVKEIVLEIAKRQGIDGNMILGDAEVVRVMGDIAKGAGLTDSSGLLPTGGVEGGEAITALNNLGGAGSVGDFAPNAAGLN